MTGLEERDFKSLDQGRSSIQELPLLEGVFGKGFMNCPLSVSISSNQIAVAHFPYQERLFGKPSFQWKELGGMNPSWISIVIGQEDVRLKRAARDLARHTTGSTYLVPFKTKYSGEAKAELVQIGGKIKIRMEETYLEEVPRDLTDDYSDLPNDLREKMLNADKRWYEVRDNPTFLEVTIDLRDRIVEMTSSWDPNPEYSIL